MKDIAKIKKLNNYIYMSFFLAFLGLAGTTLLTLLGSLSTYNEKQKYLRAGLVSETGVNIIAGFTYYYLINYLYQDGMPLENVMPIRYLDWLITTPFLILSFIWYSGYQVNKESGDPGLIKVDYTPLSYIIPLNFCMLIFGYLGESKILDKNTAFAGGIGCYSAMFYLIFDKYVKGKPNAIKEIYYPFLAIWLLYGFAYYLPIKSKNVTYNILDLIAKSGFGVFLWINSVNDLDN